MSRVFVYILCAAIVATIAGGLGGSYQPARIIIIAGAPLLLLYSTFHGDTPPVVRSARTMMAVMLLLGGLSLSWSMDPKAGVGMLFAVGVGFLALLLASSKPFTVQDLRLLIWAWVAVGALSIPIAFYEITTGNHFQYALEDRNIGGTFGEFPFASIFFGNYNDYSAWLCLVFTLTLPAFLQVRSFILKSLVMLLNVLILYIVFVNTSRLALSYCAGLVILYCIMFPSFRTVFAVACLAFIPLVFAQYGTDILDIYDLAVYRFSVAREIDESYIQRSGLIGIAIKSLSDTFGLGVGIGSFDEYVNRYYPYYIGNPHNIIIEISFNFGLMALLSFIIFGIRLFITGFKRKDLPPEFRMSIISGCVAIPIVGAISSHSVGYIYWWVWLATLLALANASTCETARPKAERKSRLS